MLHISKLLLQLNKLDFREHLCELSLVPMINYHVDYGIVLFLLILVLQIKQNLELHIKLFPSVYHVILLLYHVIPHSSSQIPPIFKI